MSPQPPESAVDAEAVAGWLAQHPDFFNDRPALLAGIEVPHKPAGAISLVERQLQILRGRNAALEQQLGRIMAVARENDRLFGHTRQLVLNLLDARSLEEIISTLDDSLRHQFQVPYPALILFSDSPLPVGHSLPRHEAEQQLGDLLASHQTLCGTFRPHEMAFLFGEDARQIGSAALAAIGDYGLLAIGSPDPNHYGSSLGTLFVGYIAETLQRLLARQDRLVRPA